MSTEIIQPPPRKSRFYLNLGLFNFLLGVVVGSSPWVLLLFKDSLPSTSPLVFNGGGIAVALITIPFAFLLSFTGISLMLYYRFSKKSVRPEGTPLPFQDIVRVILSAIFLLIAIWHIGDLAGVHLIL